MKLNKIIFLLLAFVLVSTLPSAEAVSCKNYGSSFQCNWAGGSSGSCLNFMSSKGCDYNWCCGTSSDLTAGYAIVYETYSTGSSYTNRKSKFNVGEDVYVRTDVRMNSLPSQNLCIQIWIYGPNGYQSSYSSNCVNIDSSFTALTGYGYKYTGLKAGNYTAYGRIDYTSGGQKYAYDFEGTKFSIVQTCTTGWKCKDSKTKGYQSTDCSWSSLTDCGSNTCNSWGSNYCSSGNVVHNRTCYDKGCSSGSCYSNSRTETETVQTCQNGCSNGACTTCKADGQQCSKPGTSGLECCSGLCNSQSYCGKISNGKTCQINDECVSGKCVNGKCASCSSNSDCSSNQYCSNGECKQDICVQGTSYCKDGDVYSCSNDGSTETKLIECGDKSCDISKGGCYDTCSNECSSGQKTCEGNGYKTCGNYDSDNCTEWSSVTSCGNNQTCSSGNCINNPVCSAGWKCKDANTKAYQNSNCSWSNITVCLIGCENGHCKPGNIACSKDSDCGLSDWIEIPICKDNDVWQVYRKHSCINPGTFSATCKVADSYLAKENCSYGCSGGACLSKAYWMEQPLSKLFEPCEAGITATCRMNGICEACETKESCPQDCSKCGDGICNEDKIFGENVFTCPEDCDENFNAKFWNCIYGKGVPYYVLKQGYDLTLDTVLDSLGEDVKQNTKIVKLGTAEDKFKAIIKSLIKPTAIMSCSSTIPATSACGQCITASGGLLAEACAPFCAIPVTCAITSSALLLMDWDEVSKACKNAVLPPLCGDGFCDEGENETCKDDCPVFSSTIKVCDKLNSTDIKGITLCDTFHFDINEIMGNTYGKILIGRSDFGEIKKININDLPRVDSRPVLKGDKLIQGIDYTEKKGVEFMVNGKILVAGSNDEEIDCNYFKSNELTAKSFAEIAAVNIMCKHLQNNKPNEKCIIPGGCKILTDEGPPNSGICSDGFDNDDDGLIDDEDPGCQY